MIDRVREFVKGDPWRFVALVLILALAGAGIGLAALAGSDGEPVANPEVTTTTSLSGTTEAVAEPQDLGDPIGVDPGAAGAGLGSSFVAVKVDNAVGARPQVGIAGLPLLVEYPVEGGITRFIAILGREQATGEVGPVRSLRPVDADLLPSLASFVVSTGGEPFVVQDVTATGIGLVDPQLFELFANGDREPVHNLFLRADVLAETVGDPPPLGEGLPQGEFPGGAVAEEITLPWEETSYRYADGEYVRYLGSEPFQVLDALEGSPGQLAHDTLAVMYVAERFAGYTDGNDVPVTTFDVIGLGDLLVFHQGEVVEGNWLRGAQEDSYRFFDGNGEPFGLPQGRIYLALVPRTAAVGY